MKIRGNMHQNVELTVDELKDYVEERMIIPLATLNPSSNRVEYYIPTDYIKEWYEGEMFYQNSNPVNIIVTPHHKMWIKSIQSKNWRLCEAKYIP